MNPTTISWDGPTEGYSAYAILNRHFIAALREHGHTVIENLHTDPDGKLTPVLVSSVYPPRPPSMRHAKNVCLSTWEFHGAFNTPDSFMDVFRRYDMVHAMCQQAADAFSESGVPNVRAGFLGVDGSEFHPQGDKYPLSLPDGVKAILWVGGTDKRHGLDVALKVIDELPDDYRLIVKLAAYYPFEGIDHPRVIVIRNDLKSLAPLYRACDVFLLTARAVAPSMPVLEALASGLPVVAPALPALDEPKGWYLGNYVFLSPVWSELTQHHIHKDCQTWWHQTNPAVLAEQLVKAVGQGKPPSVLANLFSAVWNWEDAVLELEETINGIGAPKTV